MTRFAEGCSGATPVFFSAAARNEISSWLPARDGSVCSPWWSLARSLVSADIQPRQRTGIPSRYAVFFVATHTAQTQI